jgi:hypothetical protein
VANILSVIFVERTWLIICSYFCSVRFQHRRSSYKELQYICDGDSNGVLYFAGTSYGEHQWVNPVLSKVKFLILLFLFLVTYKK